MTRQRECAVCGQTFVVTRGSYRHKTCSQSCGSKLNHPHAWTERQVSILRQCYEQAGDVENVHVKAIADLIGRSPDSVRQKAHKLGLTSQHRPSRRGPRPGPGHPERECPQCGAPFKAAPNILTCSRSCGQKRALQLYGHNKGMKGKRHSEATKKSLAESSAAWYASLTDEEKAARSEAQSDAWNAVPRPPRASTYSRTKSGKRADLGGLFVRSSWEANYARYLNFLMDAGEILSWEYEPQTFEFPVKRGNRFYTPDFKVITTTGHEWHEVKGWMDDSSRIKLKRFAKHYPDETLVLVAEPEYRAISKAVSSLIPNWEGKR